MIGRVIAWLDRWHTRRDEHRRRREEARFRRLVGATNGTVRTHRLGAPRVLFLPALADPAAPTAAELAHGVDLTCHVPGDIITSVDPATGTITRAVLEDDGVTVRILDDGPCPHPAGHRAGSQVLCEPDLRWICTDCGATVVEDQDEPDEDRPAYAVGDRVKVVCDHWPGQTGGVITEIDLPHSDAHGTSYRYWIETEQDWFKASCLTRTDDEETDRG